MSAVRMVAYGVLENVGGYPKHDGTGFDKYATQRKERDEVRKLVRAELKEMDLIITPLVAQKHGGGGASGAYRAVKDKFVLYGPRNVTSTLPAHHNGWIARGVLAEGDFRECCVKAVEFMEPFNQALSPHTSNED